MGNRLKNIIKMAWGLLFYYSGTFFLMRAWNNLRGRRLTIVTYHRVAGEGMNGRCSLPYIFITRKALDFQLAFFKRHYRIINFEQLSRLSEEGGIPGNSLIITFDDGYRDNLEYALPLMERHGCPWVVMLSTGLIGSGETFWWDRLYSLVERLRELQGSGEIPELGDEISEIYSRYTENPSGLFALLNGYDTERVNEIVNTIGSRVQIDEEKVLSDNGLLAWDDLEKMKAHTEFGAHTHSHCNLTTLEASRAREEVRRSKELIETRTGKQVLALSFPAGMNNCSVVDEVREAGYAFAMTQERGLNDLRDPYRLKRINIWEGTVPSGRARYKGWLAYRMLGL